MTNCTVCKTLEGSGYHENQGVPFAIYAATMEELEGASRTGCRVCSLLLYGVLMCVPRSQIFTGRLTWYSGRMSAIVWKAGELSYFPEFFTLPG